MKINSFSYENKATGWKAGTIHLNGFNLLVGASGVGKTRLLKAILDLGCIARGEASDGVSWSLHATMAGHDVMWRGSYQSTGSMKKVGVVSEQLPSDDAVLENEVLIVDGQEIASKKGGRITFQGKELPVKLSSSSSLLRLLDEDDRVSEFASSISRISRYNSFEARVHHVFLPISSRDKSLPTIMQINHLDSVAKLVMVYENSKTIFDRIMDEFRVLFPTVGETSIQYEPLGIKLYDEAGEQRDRAETIIYFKDISTGSWFRHYEMSSGMWKTLMLIADHYLAADGSIILIDEIENGLGVNCIDVLGDLVDSDRPLQYIITSHHPYIINKVPIANWKIITRENGVVQARNAADFDLGKSKHEAFMQLMQLDAFTEGVLEA